MGIEEDLKEIIDRLATMDERVLRIEKLLQGQHEAILWQTKGKDKRVKGTMTKESNCPQCKCKPEEYTSDCQYCNENRHLAKDDEHTELG
jgi:hypothetical protein